MSFDKDAINLLQRAATMELLSAEINARQTLIPVVAVPSGFGIQSLERNMPFRSRFRGKMHTSAIADFVRYAKNHSEEAGSHCFIDAEKMTATNIFNFGTVNHAGHCDYIANLELEKTAEYKALLQFDGSKLEQRDFAEFMEDWAAYIQCVNEAGEPMPLARAISAVRRISVQASVKADSEQRNFSSEKSALESISINAENTLPAEIHFTCAPYTGLAEFKFELRVAALTSREKPLLVARIKRLEQAEQQFANEFCLLLGSLFEEAELSMPITIGKFNLSN